MRQLTDEEMRKVYEKLFRFVGNNIRQFVERKDYEYCFRLHKDRVYYIRLSLFNQATKISRKELLSVGTCFGKFTKTHKFHLHITSLDYLSPFAKNKVWLKPSAEQLFLYGNHVKKSGIGRLSEDIQQYSRTVVYSMNNIALGFGVCTKSCDTCRTAKPFDIILLHQADIGEYVRNEKDI